MLQLHFLLRLLSKQSNYRVLHRFAASIAADMVRVTVHYDFQHLHVTTLASGFSYVIFFRVGGGHLGRWLARGNAPGSEGRLRSNYGARRIGSSI